MAEPWASPPQGTGGALAPFRANKWQRAQERPGNQPTGDYDHYNDYGTHPMATPGLQPETKQRIFGPTDVPE